MSNEIKDIDIKNHTCYFFNDVINTKKFDPNKNLEMNIVAKKYSYLLHWICDDQRFEIHKN